MQIHVWYWFNQLWSKLQGLDWPWIAFLVPDCSEPEEGFHLDELQLSVVNNNISPVFIFVEKEEEKNPMEIFNLGRHRPNATTATPSHLVKNYYISSSNSFSKSSTINLKMVIMFWDSPWRRDPEQSRTEGRIPQSLENTQAVCN